MFCFMEFGLFDQLERVISYIVFIGIGLWYQELLVLEKLMEYGYLLQDLFMLRFVCCNWFYEEYFIIDFN